MYVERTRGIPWNLFTALIVALFAGFQLIQLPALPRYMDVYYHLSVANGFAMAGGYVPDAFWEFAPAGRPHLYPPLLHLIMLALSKAGLSWIAIGRTLECLLFPSFLAVLGFTVRRFSSPGIAFFTVLAASSMLSLYLDVSVYAPFSIASMLGLAAMLALDRLRTFTCAILLGLAFYTHVFMAGMFLAAIVIYGMAVRRCRGRMLAACMFAVALASPMLVHLALHRDHFALADVKEFRHFEVDPLVYVLAAAGLVLALRWKDSYLAPVCLAAVSLPLLFTHIPRFTGGHGLIGFVWLAGIGLYSCWERVAGLRGTRNAQLLAAAGAALVFFCLAPTLLVNTAEGRCSVRFFDRSLVHFALPEGAATTRPKEISTYLPAEHDKIAGLIKAHTGPLDIIWANQASDGAIFGLLAGRATSSAMVPEVLPYNKGSDPISSSRVQVWVKSTLSDVRAAMVPTVAKYGLQPVAETDLAYIYLNPNRSQRTRVREAMVPAAWVWLTLAVLGALAVFDLRGRRDETE